MVFFFPLIHSYYLSHIKSVWIKTVTKLKKLESNLWQTNLRLERVYDQPWTFASLPLGWVWISAAGVSMSGIGWCMDGWTAYFPIWYQSSTWYSWKDMPSHIMSQVDLIRLWSYHVGSSSLNMTVIDTLITPHLLMHEILYSYIKWLSVLVMGCC